MTEKIPSRGIYLLPSILTTFGMFAGFYSIIASINGDFTLAAISIMIAMMWDTLDGRVARLTNTQSAFGAQYDSLSDLVSFGVAPALLVYEWSLSDMGRVGWLAAFIYLACAALRLARFNPQVGAADKRYFQVLLMVSNVRYYIFKELDSKNASFKVLIFIVLSLIVLLSRPNILLLTGFFLYMVSGPVITIFGIYKRRQQKKKGRAS